MSTVTRPWRSPRFFAGLPSTTWPQRDRTAVAAGLAVPLLLALLLVPFRTDVPGTTSALVLVVAVVAVSALGSRAAGVLAALSAAASFDFFLTRPFGTFDITAPADVATALLLLTVGLIVSQLAARARRLEIITVTDAGYLARLHATADVVRSARSADTVVDHVRGELTDLLGLRACRFEHGILIGRPPRLRPDGTVDGAGLITPNASGDCPAART